MHTHTRSSLRLGYDRFWGDAILLTQNMNNRGSITDNHDNRYECKRKRKKEEKYRVQSSHLSREDGWGGIHKNSLHTKLNFHIIV